MFLHFLRLFVIGFALVAGPQQQNIQAQTLSKEGRDKQAIHDYLFETFADAQPMKNPKQRRQNHKYSSFIGLVMIVSMDAPYRIK